jgi:hypothetical protein
MTGHWYALVADKNSTIAVARYDEMENDQEQWSVLGELTQHRPHTPANVDEMERIVQQLNEGTKSD